MIIFLFLFFYQHSGSLSYDPYFPMSNLFFMRPRYFGWNLQVQETTLFLLFKFVTSQTKESFV